MLVRAGVEVRSLELEYDLSGNVIKRSAGAQSESVTYDQLDRMRVVTNASGTAVLARRAACGHTKTHLPH